MRGRGGLTAELKYRYTKWRLQRARRKFDVHQGGRGGGVERALDDISLRSARCQTSTLHPDLADSASAPD